MNEHSTSGPAAADLAARDVWIFDLDNTLYAAGSHVFPQVSRRIGEYVARHLGLEMEEARRVQKRYFHQHGTTLHGLMIHHDVDPIDYMNYVHDIDLGPIGADTRLNDALGRLGGRKIVFTNASTAHAERVLNHLGIAEHFSAIFDIVAAGFLPKPHRDSYLRLLDRHDIDPGSAVMVEDMAKNLVPAAALGMTTLWVAGKEDWQSDGAGGDHIHHITDDLPGWLQNICAEAGC